MSKTFRRWVLILAVCAAAGLSAHPSPAGAEGGPRSQVRMSVDFTVLPVVLPDGSEAPAMPAAAPDQGGETSPAPPAPEMPAPEAPAQEAAASETPAPEAQNAPEAKTAPETAEAPEPAPAGPGQILSVNLEETGSGIRLVIATDREAPDASYFNLDEPRRLVVDLPGKWTRKGGNVIRSEGPAVQHVVMGEHPDRFRLVVHFRTPPEGDLEPTFTRAENELFVAVPLP